jgi:hypothetical protein
LSTPSNIDYVSKIDSILAAVNEIKTTVSKHEQIFGKLNRKIDDVLNHLRDLGVRTPYLKIK